VKKSQKTDLTLYLHKMFLDKQFSMLFNMGNIPYCILEGYGSLEFGTMKPGFFEIKVIQK